MLLEVGCWVVNVMLKVGCWFVYVLRIGCSVVNVSQHRLLDCQCSSKSVVGLSSSLSIGC